MAFQRTSLLLLAFLAFPQFLDASTLSILVKFNNTNGAFPDAGLIQGSDGNYYGTTTQGGSSGYGTAFKLTPGGTLTTMINFNSTNGSYPQAGLIQGSDGNFYGTTYLVGFAGYGNVFRLDATTSENVSFSSASAIPIITSSYTITGSALNLTLSYAPSPGDVLTVIQNTGGSPISGTFTNLSNGGTISATYNGVTYTFTANYSGGAGNDLTLTLASIVNPADTPLLPIWACLGCWHLHRRLPSASPGFIAHSSNCLREYLQWRIKTALRMLFLRALPRCF
jgi:uncharacterized repeat protein (TIGR03803 family)